VESPLDRLNRRAWARPQVVERFAHLEVWPEDEGEAVLIDRAAEEFRGQPILDVGIGGGRTVPLLRAISEDYVGIDYTQEMIDAAVARFPGVRCEWGDARDLSKFADASFGLVFFSANGIDAVDHEGRLQIVAETRRVLRPGGVYAVSTHNLEHRNAGRAPWDPRQRWPRDPRRVLRRVLRLPKAVRGHLRNRRLVVNGDGWAMLNTPLYDFGLVIHYASLDETLRELTDAGFSPDVEVYDMFGQRLGPGASTADTKWFHLLARVPR
jgi:SAM-dependent methyltransferase